MKHTEVLMIGVLCISSLSLDHEIKPPMSQIEWWHSVQLWDVVAGVWDPPAPSPQWKADELWVVQACMIHLKGYCQRDIRWVSPWDPGLPDKDITVYLSLSLTHTHTHTHTYTHSLSLLEDFSASSLQQYLSLFLSLSLILRTSQLFQHILSFSLSLSHTHSHSRQTILIGIQSSRQWPQKDQNTLLRG